MRVNIFKIKKAVTKLCLTAALLLSAVTISNLVSPSITAYAAEDGTITISDTITVTISEGGTKATFSGTGTIPRIITASTPLISGCNTIETVVVEEGITSLGNGSFNNFSALKNISLPQSLTSIESNSFSNCTSLTEITIPKNVTSANALFKNSNLTTITFEEGMTKLPIYVCDGATKLTTVNLPSTLTTIQDGAFRNTTSLNEIVIPKNVTTVGTSVFSGTGLTTITFEEGMTTIPNNACKGATALTTVNIPNSVTKLGYYIFDGCTSLKEITIPKSVTTVSSTSNSTLGNSSIETITFEAGMTTIPNYICSNATKLTTVNIPKSVTSIGSQAFYKCSSLTEITIPGGVTSIGNNAFYVATETTTTVTTSSQYVMSYNWTSFNRIVTFIDPSAFQEGLTMTGTVSPITTIDITIPLDAFQFRIDEERNLEVQTTEIVNNSQYPLEMYILNIEATNDEPNIVAKDTFTEKEWNNLSAAQTLSNIAISLNEHELYTIFNNTELDNSKAIKIGDIKSGFVEAQILEVTPDVQYGKAFYNTDEVTLTYKIVFEVVIP